MKTKEETENRGREIRKNERKKKKIKKVGIERAGK